MMAFYVPRIVDWSERWPRETHAHVDMNGSDWRLIAPFGIMEAMGARCHFTGTGRGAEP